MASAIQTSNLLLSRLEEEDSEALQPYLTRVSLDDSDILTKPFEPVEFVYFLENGIASVVSDLNDRAEAQVGIIGYEGMTGTSVILGVTQTPFRTCLHGGSADALQLSVARLVSAMRDSATLNTVFQHYAHVSAVQAAESAAVNASFDITRRIARFLLMCHDRMPSNRLVLTHQLTGQLLDVRRPGVSVVLKSFEDANAIACHRGSVTIKSRNWLKTAAGKAYGTSEGEYRRLLGPFGKSASDTRHMPVPRQAMHPGVDYGIPQNQNDGLV